MSNVKRSTTAVVQIDDPAHPNSWTTVFLWDDEAADVQFQGLMAAPRKLTVSVGFNRHETAVSAGIASFSDNPPPSDQIHRARQELFKSHQAVQLTSKMHQLSRRPR